MINKNTRQHICVTRDDLAHSWQKWADNAYNFYQAAKKLYEMHTDISDINRLSSAPFEFNAALSLELIMKAICLVQNHQNQLTEEPRPTHDLVKLSETIQIVLSENQKRTLGLLTQQFMWAARYPVPKKNDESEDYYDKLENLVKETEHKEGNTTTRSTYIDREIYPDISNYQEIWDICVNKFKAPANEIEKQRIPTEFEKFAQALYPNCLPWWHDKCCAEGTKNARNRS